MFDNLFETIKNLSILLGVWLAIYGIDSWRRELKGRREIELAEETLALFYEARDAIIHMRSIFSFNSETADIERDSNETDAQFDSRKNASIVYKRYAEHQEVFNRLYSIRYRFMAQIGVKEAEPFDDLQKLVHEIFIAARRLAQLWPRNHFRTDEQYEKHLAQVEKYEAIFWEGIENEDPINLRLEAIMQTIEKTCRNIVSGKGTLFGMLNKRIFKRRL